MWNKLCAHSCPLSGVSLMRILDFYYLMGFQRLPDCLFIPAGTISHHEIHTLLLQTLLLASYVQKPEEFYCDGAATVLRNHA